MSRATLVVLAVLAATVLAGCSKAPPSGELSGGTFSAAVEGTAVVDYVARQRPASQLPPAEDVACPPAGSPSQVPQCVDASSSFQIHFMALPEPDGTYEVVLANAT